MSMCLSKLHLASDVTPKTLNTVDRFETESHNVY